jgi:hypothetical protein
MTVTNPAHGYGFKKTWLDVELALLACESLGPDQLTDRRTQWGHDRRLRGNAESTALPDYQGFLSGPGRTRTCARRIMSPLL